MRILWWAYLAPAIVDFALALLTLYRMIDVADDSVVPRSQLVAVTFSWAVMLLVGMRKPVERAWMLWPTALVIGCIGAAVVWGHLAGVVSTVRLVLVLALCAALIWLCLAGIKFARSQSGNTETPG